MKTPIASDTPFFNAPDPSVWTGRKTAAEEGMQYWYQAIKFAAFNQLTQEKSPDIGLLGYACDAGVQRNQGQPGAKAGPQAFRQRLGKLAFHHPLKQIADFGNVCCPDDALEKCQQVFAEHIQQLLSHGIFPIAIGGGHDIAYGHFKGIWEAVRQTAQKKIGILNFDAHFDLRPLRPQSSSGTPFYQILNEFPEHSAYFALGIQEASNPPELFAIAEKHRVGYFTLDACERLPFSEITEALTTFINSINHLYITIDLDGFSSAIAPGVSAPNPLGLSPRFVMDTLAHCFQSQKVIACDLAELNPSNDRADATANLAARLVDRIVALKQ